MSRAPDFDVKLEIGESFTHLFTQTHTWYLCQTQTSNLKYFPPISKNYLTGTRDGLWLWTVFNGFWRMPLSEQRWMRMKQTWGWRQSLGTVRYSLRLVFVFVRISNEPCKYFPCVIPTSSIILHHPMWCTL